MDIDRKLLRVAAVLEKQAARKSRKGILQQLEGLVRSVSSASKSAGYIINSLTRFGRHIVSPALRAVVDAIIGLIEKIRSGLGPSPADYRKVLDTAMRLSPEERDLLVEQLQKANRE